MTRILVTIFNTKAYFSTRSASLTQPIGRTLMAVLCLSCIGLVLGCGNTPEPGFNKPKPPAGLVNQVVAVSYPLKFITEQIVPDDIGVVFPAAGAADPRTWKPDRKSIGQMQAVDLIIANGTPAPYAKWLTQVSLPESKVCNTATKGLLLRDYIAVEDVTITHSHGPEGEHSHAMMVSRTWLDPSMAKKQASYIAEKLKALYPSFSDQLGVNLVALNAELDSLISLVNEVKAKQPGPVLTATPELKFLTRAVGMADEHLAWTDDVSAEQAEKDLDKALKAIAAKANKVKDKENIATATESPLKPKLMLFADKAPSSEIRKLLEKRGIQFVVISLIDNRPEFGSYLTEVSDNLKKLSRALEQN